MAHKSLLAILSVCSVTAQTYVPTPMSQDNRNNMSDCGRSCMDACRHPALDCVGGGHVPEGQFFKFLGCIYHKAKKHDEMSECHKCLESHHKLLTRETVDKCLGVDQHVVKDKCSAHQYAHLCNGASADSCKWINRKCYSTAEDLTYNAYRQILFQVEDEQVCALLGGYVKRGLTCAARKAQHVKCRQINSRTVNPSFYSSCANICDWMPKCKYDVESNKCLGYKPFTTNQ